MAVTDKYKIVNIWRYIDNPELGENVLLQILFEFSYSKKYRLARLQNGMSQTEQVEIKIPAFHTVSVFDISQMYGWPVPELMPHFSKIKSSVCICNYLWYAIKK